MSGITYSIKRTRRARRITITVRHNGDVVVSMPHWMPVSRADTFISQKADWIRATQAKLARKFLNKIVLKQSKKDFEENKKRVLEFVKERLGQFNKHYNFKIADIKIKSQKNRWGSCSSKGNLNFNYQIIKLPKEIADYIVVHELCHIKEFNHSKNFWNLVAETIPDHLELRKNLKKNYIHIT
jgi:predicted metal-dependent hydrolase